MATEKKVVVALERGNPEDHLANMQLLDFSYNENKNAKKFLRCYITALFAFFLNEF